MFNTKKGKDPLREYLKLKNEMIREKVDTIFRTQPENWRESLEEIGFKYYDALQALRNLFEPGTEKRKIIDFLITQEAEEHEAPVRFDA
jgi:hypothetical protein